MIDSADDEKAMDERAMMVNNAADAIYLIGVESDGSFRFLQVNDAYRTLADIDSVEVRGMRPEQVLGGEAGARVVANLHRCVASATSIDVEEKVSRGESDLYWHTVLSPVVDGGEVTAVVGISRDVTARYKTEQELRYLSEMDPLTGIANRRKIGAELERELSRAQRHGHPLSVAMIDVDHFKQVNDSYGHETGDAVLRGVAAAVQATLRPSDRLGRWGGEEFVALLAETGQEGALTVAERIRTAIEDAPLVPGHSVTVSIGVASMPSSPPVQTRHISFTPDDLLRTADEELYRAKERGRNRVVSSASDTT